MSNRRKKRRTRSGVSRGSVPPKSKENTRADRLKAGFGVAWVLGFLALGIGISFSLAFGDPPSDRGEQSISDDAELYMVNNTSCAMSGSTIDPEDLGRYQSFVRYDGPDERYRGKTLVFNQCCEMCITSFPEKWALERDDIMIDLGLVEATP